jgi:hypothetical protein
VQRERAGLFYSSQKKRGPRGPSNDRYVSLERVDVACCVTNAKSAVVLTTRPELSAEKLRNCLFLHFASRIYIDGKIDPECQPAKAVNQVHEIRFCVSSRSLFTVRYLDLKKNPSSNTPPYRRNLLLSEGSIHPKPPPSSTSTSPPYQNLNPNPNPNPQNPI